MKHLIKTHLSVVSPPAEAQDSDRSSNRSSDQSASTIGFGYLDSDYLDSDCYDFDYLDQTAIVTVTIRPYQPGQIYFQGSWWRAVCVHNTEIACGKVVRVVGMRHITYIVEPLC